MAFADNLGAVHLKSAEPLVSIQVRYNRIIHNFRDYLAALRAGDTDAVHSIGRKLEHSLADKNLNKILLKQDLMRVMVKYDIGLEWDNVRPPGW